MDEKLYDVVAVNIKTGEVRLLATGKSHGNADAIVNMAVARRGLDEEFYSEAIHGQYKDGDKWEGKGDIKPYEPETSEGGGIQRIGDMWYPVGPRGL